jgi:hypothetical protein
MILKFEKDTLGEFLMFDSIKWIDWEYKDLSQYVAYDITLSYNPPEHPVNPDEPLITRVTRPLTIHGRNKNDDPVIFYTDFTVYVLNDEGKTVERI